MKDQSTPLEHNPASSRQAVMFSSLGGHVTIELQGKTARCWFHNYHDLLLWSITSRAVGEAPINHHYLYCNKSQGSSIKNHNSHSLQMVITYLWRPRYVTKVAQEAKKYCKLHCLEDLASLNQLLSFARKEEIRLTISSPQYHPWVSLDHTPSGWSSRVHLWDGH